MLDRLLPNTIVAVELVERQSACPLLVKERESLGTVSPERFAQFQAGRHCARRAMSILESSPPRPILIHPSRAPKWPPHIVGSITHTTEYAAAVVARDDHWRAIGIDVESRKPVSAEELEVITTSADRAHLAKLPNNEDSPWELLLFSAKESLYKAWSPLTGVWLGFHDAQIVIDPDSQTFQAVIDPAKLAESPPPLDLRERTFSGRFLTCQSYIATVVLLPHSTSS